MRWEDVFDIVESLNSRGEKVYDVYVKGDKQAVYVDIPIDKIDDFMKVVVKINDIIAMEEFDRLFDEKAST